MIEDETGKVLTFREIEASMVGPLAVGGVPTSVSQGFTVPASDVNRSRTYSIRVTVEGREASGTALNAAASLRVSFN